MPASRQACPVGLWLATSTSICRRIATICSALCFFLAMLQPPLVPVSLTFPLVQNSPVRSLARRKFPEFESPEDFRDGSPRFLAEANSLIASQQKASSDNPLRRPYTDCEF